MSRYIIVRLTEKEAREALHAMGNSLDSPEDALAIFADDRRNINAACRAADKIERALYHRTTPTKRRPIS